MASSTPLYDHIGTHYNATRRADPYLAGRLRTLLQPEKDHIYLDIGCGTGNYTTWLAQQEFRFFGVDPSEKMLAEAKAKSSAVTWLEGSAEAIPAADDFFAGAVATLTVHHWKDLRKAFRELARVLRPGARIVLFTSTPGQMAGYWLNHYFPEMLKRSAGQMPSFETIRAASEEAGFRWIAQEPYEVREDLADLFLYSGKHRPEMYFDPVIRRGISSFAALANRAEVERGLAQLQDDLAGGTFAEVQGRYANARGDYLFLVGEKLIQ